MAPIFLATFAVSSFQILIWLKLLEYMPLIKSFITLCRQFALTYLKHPRSPRRQLLFQGPQNICVWVY